jgi:predicted nucleic acid-binding protein
VREGYWIRAAEARSKLLAHRLRARLPDALIAQSCLDHDLPLITRDRDFRHFVEHCGLRLA